MITRHLVFKMKAGATETEINRLFEEEVLPILHEQKGFRDLIVCVAPERGEFMSLSFWESKELAEAYHRGVFNDLTGVMSRVTEGPPHVEIYELGFSTFHKLFARGV